MSRRGSISLLSMAVTPLCLTFAFLLSTAGAAFHSTPIDYGESTISDIQSYFHDGSLSSRQLVSFYLTRIQSLNPYLRAVIELNPDALADADIADRQRRSGSPLAHGILHGIPILLKDNIATRDRLNTTAGSLALLGSIVPRDAGVSARLRSAGAIILGKASLSEWSNFRTQHAPNGWSALGGQGVNPYVATADPSGSSSGSAIAVAAGMAAASLGTDTGGSINYPASFNSVVGIRPTVGLTSRSGVIPVTLRQDTVGPMARSVADAVAVLEAIVGYDDRDADATAAAAGFIPEGGYRQFLKEDGLKGKRVGILGKGFSDFPEGSLEQRTLDQHFEVLRKKGAIVIDDLTLPNISDILNVDRNYEEVVIAEFKHDLNAYLSDLLISPVRSLADLITFNDQHKIEEKTQEYGQTWFLKAEKTNGLGAKERAAIKRIVELSENGLERLMKEKKLDAVVTPGHSGSPILSFNGYPGINVPAGYGKTGIPFGICFGGLKGSEPTLIEIAYAFEQATKARKPPLLSSAENQAECESEIDHEEL